MERRSRSRVRPAPLVRFTCLSEYFDTRRTGYLVPRVPSRRWLSLALEVFRPVSSPSVCTDGSSSLRLGPSSETPLDAAPSVARASEDETSEDAPARMQALTPPMGSSHEIPYPYSVLRTANRVPISQASLLNLRPVPPGPHPSLAFLGPSRF